MSSIRFVSLAALALVALTSVACAPSSYEDGEGEKAGSFGLGKPATAPGNTPATAAGVDEQTPTAAGAGTCDATCTHYLTCKGASSPANQQTCVTNCNSLKYSSADMAMYAQTDCATAIKIVEGDTPATTSSSGGSNTATSECDGCVADGSYCIWTSKSDWGKSGAYSGAVTECASHCCQ